MEDHDIDLNLPPVYEAEFEHIFHLEMALALHSKMDCHHPRPAQDERDWMIASIRRMEGMHALFTKPEHKRFIIYPYGLIDADGKSLSDYCLSDKIEQLFAYFDALVMKKPLDCEALAMLSKASKYITAAKSALWTHQTNSRKEHFPADQFNLALHQRGFEALEEFKSRLNRHSLINFIQRYAETGKHTLNEALEPKDVVTYDPKTTAPAQESKPIVGLRLYRSRMLTAEDEEFIPGIKR